MNYYLNAALSLWLGVPAAIGWIRYQKTDRSYFPLLLLLTVGFFNEIVSIVSIRLFKTNMINYNLYSLGEGMLILWQLFRWKALERRWVYLGLQTALVLLWVWEGLVLHDLFRANSYHLIAYAAVVVGLSIHLLNWLIYYEPLGLHKNARYLICLAWIVFFTYSIIVEAFYLYGQGKTQTFRVYVLGIRMYVNLFSNLLLTLAVLWIPLSSRYITQLLFSARSSAD